MKVSVIIPCYNQSAYIRHSIQSLQNQTLQDWEAIVVDDGSTDNIAEVVGKISAADKRVRLVQQNNGGSASARDRGLKEAQGDFIQFLDADDTIAPEKFERQVALMEYNKSDFSYTAFCSENSKGERTKSRMVLLSLFRVLVRWGLGASVPIHAFLYRSDFIQRHNLSFKSDCRFREDWKWHIQCFIVNPIIVILTDYCGAIYYRNETSKTGSYLKMQEGNFAFMAYMLPQLHGYNRLLWLYRVSEELWIWLLRILKYRSSESFRSISALRTRKGLLSYAILLMPLSVFSIIRYFIKTYIAR